MKESTNSLSLNRSKWIESAIISLTFDGALQRGDVYIENLPSEERKAFRDSVAEVLKRTLDGILENQSYDDQSHYFTIEAFTCEISKKHKDKLKNKELRIGTAQKMLNLYWKVSWMLKPETRTPIHCPYDSLIINSLDSNFNEIKWTKMNNMCDYKKLVGATKALIQNTDYDNIAMWELAIYPILRAKSDQKLALNVLSVNDNKQIG